MTTSTADYPVVEVILDVSEVAEFDEDVFASGVISRRMLSEWHKIFGHLFHPSARTVIIKYYTPTLGPGVPRGRCYK